jgi:hypothetical protein
MQARQWNEQKITTHKRTTRNMRGKGRGYLKDNHPINVHANQASADQQKASGTPDADHDEHERYQL